MPTLSAGQIASMRLAVDDSLDSAVLPNGEPSIVEILQNQGIADGLRGKSDAWVSVRSYSCVVTAETPTNEILRAGKIQATERYKFELPADADVDPANRLRWNGATFEVKAMALATSNSVEVLIFAVKVG